MIIISRKIWYTKEIIKPNTGRNTSWQKLAKLYRDLTPNSHQICRHSEKENTAKMEHDKGYSSPFAGWTLWVKNGLKSGIFLQKLLVTQKCISIQTGSSCCSSSAAHQPILDQPRALNVMSMLYLGQLRSNYSGRRVNTFTHGHAGSLNKKKFWTGVQQLPNYCVFQPGRAGTWQLLRSVKLQFLRALGASQSIFRSPSAFASRLYR